MEETKLSLLVTVGEEIQVLGVVLVQSDTERSFCGETNNFFKNVWKKTVGAIIFLRRIYSRVI